MRPAGPGPAPRSPTAPAPIRSSCPPAPTTCTSRAAASRPPGTGARARPARPTSRSRRHDPGHRAGQGDPVGHRHPDGHGSPVAGATVSAWDATAGPGPVPRSPTAPAPMRSSCPPARTTCTSRAAASRPPGTGAPARPARPRRGDAQHDPGHRAGQGTLSGIVTLTADGSPVAGATVSAWDATSGVWTGAAVTDGSGAYAILLPAGSTSCTSRAAASRPPGTGARARPARPTWW